MDKTMQDEYEVKLVSKSQQNGVPAMLFVRTNGVLVQKLLSDRTSSTESPPSNLSSSSSLLSSFCSVLRIQREQLLDCCLTTSIKSRLFNRSRGIVKMCYLEFNDDILRKAPDSRYGLVLRKQVIYLVLKDNYAAAKLVQRIQTLMTSKKSNPQKPYLVFINPCSGTGRALWLFKTKVAPVFKRLGIPYQLFKTEYPGHAEYWIKQSSLRELIKYRGLITMSGDGMVYELVNGLAYRTRELDDDDEGLEQNDPGRSPPPTPPRDMRFIPLGFLPAGGGNAAASVMCYMSGLASRENCLFHATDILSHNPQPSEPVSDPNFERVQQIRPMDAILFETANPRTQRIGVLSIEWGGLADLDLRSENFRWLGQTRFAVATLISLAKWSLTDPKNKQFRAKVSYLPFSTTAPSTNGSCASGDQKKSTAPTPPANPVPLGPCSVPIPDSIQRKNGCPENPSSPWSSNRYSPDREKFWKRHYLPAVNEPVPNHWETITDNFWTILVTNHSHISTDAILHPHARFDNGHLNLVIIYSTVKCSDLFKLSQSLASGQGICDTAYWKVIPILALRVEPEIVASCTMLDGERVSPGPFQAEIVPQQFSVITCPVGKCSPNSD